MHDDEPVTRRDLEAATTTLRGEIATLGAELRSEMKELRSELVAEINENTRHVFEVGLEQFRTWFGALENKYSDVPRQTQSLRADLDEHRSDWTVHVRPAAPRARRARTRKAR